MARAGRILAHPARRVKAGAGRWSTPLLERRVIAAGRAEVDLPRTGDLLVLVEEHLLPLGEPARRPRDREEHGEHVDREPHGLVDQPRVEVHVRVELALAELRGLAGYTV